MGKNKEIIPNFWSVYWSFNRKRFSKSCEFIDANTGEKLTYSFIGAEKIKNDLILSILTMILWISPAFLIVILSVLYAQVTLWSFPIAILAAIAYHFAGMYYCIRGPMIEYKKVKKHLFFG